jgi:single-strand DNA-binding protein
MEVNSMNRVDMVGRLTRDPDIRYTSGDNQTCVARFTIAVNRNFKNAQGEYDADFISCIAFGKTGEFIEKYFKKGSRIGLSGRIQTGSYTNKDGQKVYTTYVVAENIEFVDSKPSGSVNESSPSQNQDDDFMNIPDEIVEDLPFN